MKEEDRYKLEIPLRSVVSFGAENRQIMCVLDGGRLCGGCVFKDHPYCEVFNCIGETRTDGNDVMFVEIKEVVL